MLLCGDTPFDPRLENKHGAVVRQVSGLECCAHTLRLQVRSPVRAHTGINQ